MGVLLNVDQHAARRPLRNDAFVGNQIGVLGSHRSRDNLAESTQLLLRVDGFDGNEDVDPGSA